MRALPQTEQRHNQEVDHLDLNWWRIITEGFEPATAAGWIQGLTHSLSHMSAFENVVRLLCWVTPLDQTTLLDLCEDFNALLRLLCRQGWFSYRLFQSKMSQRWRILKHKCIIQKSKTPWSGTHTGMFRVTEIVSLLTDELMSTAQHISTWALKTGNAWEKQDHLKTWLMPGS